MDWSFVTLLRILELRWVGPTNIQYGDIEQELRARLVELLLILSEAPKNDDSDL